DLYFRINVISMEVPPLRDRTDDILPLAHLFMQEFTGAFSREISGFTPTAEEALLEHPWRGNVRELRNRVERAVALSTSPGMGREALFSAERVEPEAVAGPSSTLEEVIRRAERQHIRAALARAGGRVEEAAKLLGVSRSTLFEKIRKLDMRA